MEKEKICDNCGIDLTSIASENRIEREIYSTLCGSVVCHEDEGAWLNFCTVQCSLEYLKLKKGIRFLYDNEGYCDKEGKFCLECPILDRETRICKNDKYWTFCTRCMNEDHLGPEFQECQDCPVAWGKPILNREQIELEQKMLTAGVFRCL